MAISAHSPLFVDLHWRKEENRLQDILVIITIVANCFSILFSQILVVSLSTVALVLFEFHGPRQVCLRKYHLSLVIT